MLFSIIMSSIKFHSNPTPVSLFLHIFFLILLSFVSHSSTSEEAQVPNFAFSWLNDNNNFQAGDTATIKVKVLGEFNSKGNASLDRTAFRPILTVNDKVGNSSFVSGVILDTSGDTENWRIFFTPIRVGVFNVLLNDDPFKVFDSSLHFQVVPGKIYPSVCIASWMDVLNEYEAGLKAKVLIVPRDAFGNNVTSTGEDLDMYNFTVLARHSNGSYANTPNITSVGWNEFEFIIIEFLAAKAGTFFLDVIGGNETLNGSPLAFKVNPGPLEVSNSMAKLKFDTRAWQIFSMMEIYIHQQDHYGNLVPGFYEFDADVIQKETNLSIPIADLHFEEVMPGIQLFSFLLLEPGDFLLTISDTLHNRTISDMPLCYTVFIGYCDGSASIVNGSGLNGSIAGETSQFSLYLKDIFQYPSFVEVESIQVQIVRELDSSRVQPNIYPMINGSGDGLMMESALAPAINLSNTSFSYSRVLADAFNVIFTPQKSGTYEIFVYCGNVLLNNGHSFKKEVKAGEVDVSLSRVMKFSTKVPKLMESEIMVQLMDSFSNPVPSQQLGLKMEIASGNTSTFSGGMFVDNSNGSYNGHYLVKEVGTFEMCVSFDGKNLQSCPFLINAYSEEYFPRAIDDNVFVWEDESIAFDVLANDLFAGNKASIVDFSKPDRGSLLHCGDLLRYTPYQDYYGNDSFTYTISDENGNLASAAVNISVLNIPPQFISFPSQLQATEDVISPRYGGFSGFGVRYSDPTENISVTLSALSGSVLLSPMPMHFWKPLWGEFSVRKGGHEEEDLILEGSVEVINVALHSIQYLGKKNFSGEDTLQISASNTNGKNSLSIPITVEPINDPPFINIPRFIILKPNGDESLLLDKAEHNFSFSIGDPDLFNFPGLESHFIVRFSVEVDDGFLVTSLPAELIGNTELKLMNSNQWQPLQTYVTIHKHFLVKANGIRIRGTIDDCNNVMRQLSYHVAQGEEEGTILTVKVNDMGHFGRCSDCTESIAMPLQVEATVNLICKRPLGSVAAYSLGLAIIIEFAAVLSLGVILLFFTCKCVILLAIQRRRRGIQNLEPPNRKASQGKMSDTGSAENTSYFTRSYSSPFLPQGQGQGQPSNFRQRSNRKFGAEESRARDMSSSFPSSSGRRLHDLP